MFMICMYHCTTTTGSLIFNVFEDGKPIGQTSYDPNTNDVLVNIEHPKWRTAPDSQEKEESNAKSRTHDAVRNLCL